MVKLAALVLVVMAFVHQGATTTIPQPRRGSSDDDVRTGRESIGEDTATEPTSNANAITEEENPNAKRCRPLGGFCKYVPCCNGYCRQVTDDWVFIEDYRCVW